MRWPPWLASMRCILVVLLPIVCSYKVRQKIYVTLNDNTQCFRILNGTREIGCQSSEGGNSGVVQLVNSTEDVSYIAMNKAGHAPYIPVFFMNSPMFTTSQMVLLKRSGYVNGFIVIQSNESVSNSLDLPHSDDYSCPNEGTSMYATNSTQRGCRDLAWNAPGEGMWFQDWDVPIFLLKNTTEIDLVMQCYNQFNKPLDNRTWPLCAVDLTLRMNAALDAPTCLRRSNLFARLDANLYERVCDPLADDNLYSFIPPTSKHTPLNTSSIFLIAARMDGFSMFDQNSPAADAALSGLIALMAVAQAIGQTDVVKLQNGNTSGRHVMFALFNGESLDYIGSSRMVWEISQQNFPNTLDEKLYNQSALLSLEHLYAMVELSQVALPENGKYYMHVDPGSARANTVVKKLIDALRAHQSNIVAPDYSLQLPPASVQSFLKNATIPAIVLADHSRNFTNKYYHSVLDVSSRLPLATLNASITNLASAVSQVVYNWLLTGDVAGSAPAAKANVSVVSELVQCFYVDGNCTLFNQIVNSQDPTQTDVDYLRKVLQSPLVTYIGPKGANPHMPRWLASYILPYFLGETLPDVNASECKWQTFSTTEDEIFAYQAMLDLLNSNDQVQRCFKSTVQSSLARSPAFDLDGYDFTSGQYSTWVESVWGSHQLRVFLKPSPMWQGGVLGIGICVFVISLFVVFVTDRHSDLLFTPASTLQPAQL